MRASVFLAMLAIIAKSGEYGHPQQKKRCFSIDPNSDGTMVPSPETTLQDLTQLGSVNSAMLANMASLCNLFIRCRRACHRFFCRVIFSRSRKFSPR